MYALSYFLTFLHTHLLTHPLPQAISVHARLQWLATPTPNPNPTPDPNLHQAISVHARLQWNGTFKWDQRREMEAVVRR